MARKCARQILFLVNINQSMLLTYPNKFFQIRFGTGKQAPDMVAAAVKASNSMRGPAHGMIMQAAAPHYRLMGDEAWLALARPVLERACAAALRLREAWMARLPRDNWCYGLMPPFETGDATDARCCYYLSHAWYTGLQAVAAALEESGDTDAKLSEQIQDFRQSLRQAMERTIATTPVVRVRDGTYRRYLGWQPYLRGMTTGMQFGHGIDGAYVDCVAGGVRYVPDVFQPQEPIVGELLDVYEDVILISELFGGGLRPTQRASRGPEDGGDWLSWTGFNRGRAGP